MDTSDLFNEERAKLFGHMSLDVYRPVRTILSDDKLPTFMIEENLKEISEYNSSEKERANYTEWESPFFEEYRLFHHNLMPTVMMAKPDGEAIGVFTHTHPQMLPEYQGKGIGKYLYLAEAFMRSRVLFPSTYSQSGWDAQTKAHKFVIETIAAMYPDKVSDLISAGNIIRYRADIPALQGIDVSATYNHYNGDVDLENCGCFMSVDDEDFNVAKWKPTVIQISKHPEGENIIQEGLIDLGKTSLWKSMKKAYPKADGPLELDGYTIELHKPSDVRLSKFSITDPNGNQLSSREKQEFLIERVLFDEGFTEVFRTEYADPSQVGEVVRKKFLCSDAVPAQHANFTDDAEENAWIL